MSEAEGGDGSVADTLDLERVPRAARSDATLEPTLAPRFRGGRRRPSPPTPAPLVDTRLTLRGKLADGGMGTVHLGEQVRLGREVAVKTLRDEFLSPDFSARLEREARITGLVEHPNIVPVYALETDARGAPCMVMRRIEGESFRAIIRDPAHPLRPRDEDPLEFHLRVVLAVCDAIAFAHGRGILHLDLKPDNVMIGAFHDVYVVDWGVAVSVREAHRGVLPMADELEEVLGTPAYLAPELVDRELGVPGVSTDVYLLGATLFEALSGRPPHRGQGIPEILEAARRAEPQALPEGVPQELAAIVRRAMARLPAERYPDVSALRAAIARFLRHRGSTKLSDEADAAFSALRALVLAGPERGDGFTDCVRRFAECRFGYAQALRQWPENARAAEGIVEATLLFAEVYLARGDTSAAESLVGELPDVPPALQPRVDAVRSAASAARASARRAREHAEQADESQSRSARASFGLTVVAVVVLPMFLGIGLEHAGLYAWRPWHSPVYAACVLLVGTALAYRMRARLMPNRVARRYVVAFGVLAASLVFRRVLALALGRDEFAEIANDVYLVAAGAAVMGVLVDVRLHVLALTCAVAAFVIPFAPGQELLVVALAGIVGPVVMAALWRKAAR